MMVRYLCIALVLMTALAGGTALTGISGTAFSHTGATGIVKKRMDLMKSLAQSMKQIRAAMVPASGPSAAGRRIIASHAAAVERHAVTMLAMFPKGSTGHPSEALASIWKNWPGFQNSAKAMAAAARVLREQAAAGSRRTLFARFAGMARTCGGCHAQYRLKKR